MAKHLFFTERISTNQSNGIHFHSVDWLFLALQTLANKWLPEYHKHDILQYIVFRLFLFPTRFSWHTLESIVLYPNTLKKVFEGSPLYDGDYFKVWTVFAIKKFYCNFISKKPVS